MSERGPVVPQGIHPKKDQYSLIEIKKNQHCPPDPEKGAAFAIHVGNCGGIVIQRR